jgi:hypothetical protein
MKTKEMIEYLQKFDGEQEICLMVINPPDRIRHEVQNLIMVTDAGRPFIGVEVGGGIPFDEAMTKAAEEDEKNADTE